MPSDDEVRAKLGDEGVRASWRVFDVYNETEHAYRMTQGAQYHVGCGNVQGAIADLEIVKAAAERAAYRVQDAIEALQALPRTEGGTDG